MTPEALKEDITDIKRQLIEIQRTLNTVAVQDERLRQVERAMQAMWDKHDKGAITLEQIIRHQASCPRDQIRWVWWVLVPQALVLIGLLFSLLHRISAK